MLDVSRGDGQVDQVPQFGVDGRPLGQFGILLGEAEHEGLARVVGGHVRPRNEPGDRGDVQDAPALARKHVGQKQPGQLHERANVHLDHLQLAHKIAVLERATGAEARVVDEKINGDALGPQLVGDGRGSGPVAEVGGNRGCFHAEGRRQLLGKLLQSVPPTRHQHHVVPVFRKQARQLAPESCGSTSNERRSFRSSHAIP